jgi:acyl-CoA reductase-like NAD-dependent aldehyde dehydrogenase
MELGGKSPAIVLPGAEVKLAANNVSYLSSPSDRCQ